MDALVTEVHLRSVVAGLRGLGAAGVPVTALASRRSAGGLWSRHAAVRAMGPDPGKDPEGFRRTVAALATRRGGLVAYPGSEASIDALLAPGGASPGLVIPLPKASVLERLRDKRRLAELARDAGFATPHTLYEGPAAALVAARLAPPLAVKPARPGPGLGSTAVVRDPTELRALVAALPPDRQLLAQRATPGPLGSLAMVLGRGGQVVERFQQVATRTWPDDAGVSSEARSVPPDESRVERAAGLLHSAGFFGLAQLQFIEAADGPLLIDVNPRFYGSLPLALAAGVNLPAAWHRVATGQDTRGPGSYRVGVAYRWLEPDVEAACHGDLRRLLRRMPRPATGAVWAGHDPLPSLILGAGAAATRLAGRLRATRSG